jgi:hypothetical protein
LSSGNGATFVEGHTNSDGIADIVVQINGLVNLTLNDFIL